MEEEPVEMKWNKKDKKLRIVANIWSISYIWVF